MLRPPPISTLFPYTTLFRSLISYFAAFAVSIICVSSDRSSTSTNGSPLVEFVTTNSVGDRKSTRLNSSHANISYAVFCLKKKKKTHQIRCTLLDHNLPLETT